MLVPKTLLFKKYSFSFCLKSRDRDLWSLGSFPKYPQVHPELNLAKSSSLEIGPGAPCVCMDSSSWAIVGCLPGCPLVRSCSGSSRGRTWSRISDMGCGHPTYELLSSMLPPQILWNCSFVGEGFACNIGFNYLGAWGLGIQGSGTFKKTYFGWIFGLTL